MLNSELNSEGKLLKLKEWFKEQGKVAVAFSGGVDSTFLLKVAHDTLGDDCIAVTITSDVFPLSEFNEAMFSIFIL